MMSKFALFADPAKPIEISTVAVPPLLDGETLVRVTCCTLCKSDLHTHSGRRIEPTPTILGHEIVGEIVAVGKGGGMGFNGAPLEIGQRVSWSVIASCGDCFYCEQELPQKCKRLYKYGHSKISIDQPLNGGLAEYIVLNKGTALFEVPSHVSDLVAAPANCAGATAAACLRAAGEISHKVIVVCGAGLLGLHACGMAREIGASEVIVIDTDPSALLRAKGFGATRFASQVSELQSETLEATDGRGADIVLELSGGLELVAAAPNLARIGGTIVLAGSVMPTGTVSMNPETIVRKLLNLRGIHNYHPTDLDHSLQFLSGAGANLSYDSLVSAEYPLDQINLAFQAAHEQHGLRIAIRPFQ